MSCITYVFHMCLAGQLCTLAVKNEVRERRTQSAVEFSSQLIRNLEGSQAFAIHRIAQCSQENRSKRSGSDSDRRKFLRRQGNAFCTSSYCCGCIVNNLSG